MSFIGAGGKGLNPSIMNVAFNTDSSMQGRCRGTVTPLRPWVCRAMETLMLRPGWPKDRPYLRWVGSVSEDQYFAKQRMRTNVDSGNTAQAEVAALPAALATTGDIVPQFYCFMIGGNDITAGRTNVQIMADLDNLCGQVDAYWAGAVPAIVLTPYISLPGMPNRTQFIDLAADIMAGGVPNAAQTWDMLNLPTASRRAWDPIDPNYPDGHPACPDSPDLEATWDPSIVRDPQDLGVFWLACAILQKLYPEAALPLLPGEVFP